MPTLVHFVGGEQLKVKDDFNQVSSQLAKGKGGEFTGVLGHDEERVTVYRASVAFIREWEEPEPSVG